MTQEIKLKVRKEENGEMTLVTKTYEIEKVNFFKFMSITKLVNEIIETVQKDKNLSDMFTKLFANASNQEEQLDSLQRDSEFMAKAVASFQTLAVHLPEKALELLCALSNIEKEVLGIQDFDAVLNVYDAILEVNDIKELAERVKKSLALTKSAFKLKALTASVTQ